MKKQAYKIRLIIAIVVLVLAILAIWSIYPIKILDLQLSALTQRSIVTSSILIGGLFFAIILLTVLFGRFYCSTICPFGILQEVSALITRRKKKNTKTGNFPVKYFIYAAAFGALCSGSVILLRYIDPYSIFGSMVSLSTFGIIFTLCVLVLVFFKNRFFCSNICPVGTLLGLCSKISFNTINIDEEKCISCKMCEKNCQVACIDIDNKIVDNEMCVKCLKCYSVCPKGAIYYGHKKQKFSLSRRNALVSIAALTVFAAGYAMGIKFTKEIAKKVKNIILPPGAKDANKMANRCLNCNLCVKNCPNGIIQKANEKFPTVHIDYSKGKGFCKYDCHKCGEVCPSGAIERISIEEKQNTRIAMAMVKHDECVKCGHCVFVCPKGAITKEEGKTTVIDGSKCIGCGKCAIVCKPKAIEIFGIKEQNRV